MKILIGLFLFFIFIVWVQCACCVYTKLSLARFIPCTPHSRVHLMTHLNRSHTGPPPELHWSLFFTTIWMDCWINGSNFIMGKTCWSLIKGLGWSPGSHCLYTSRPWSHSQVAPGGPHSKVHMEAYIHTYIYIYVYRERERESFRNEPFMHLFSEIKFGMWDKWMTRIKTSL